MSTLNLKLNPANFLRGARKSEDALKGVAGGARKAESALDRMSRRGSKSIAGVSRMVGGLQVAVVALTVGSVAKGIGAFKEYDAALAEVSTLIAGTIEEMNTLDAAAKRLSSRFGGTATQQAQAFYQAISAGAGDATEAAEFLEVANRLAVGGVSDITTAVDVLTGSMNAYGKANLSATEASDILFTGVKFGKTTVSELGASLGDVVPIAQSLGVEFNEVVAATAALTTQGISTSKAVTGIRAAMSNILKPTSEAAKLAEELGIEFNSTSLRSKGLAGFLQHVTDKTKGNQDAMAKLFGSVEALGAVIALSGGASKAFATTLQETTVAAGATSEAYLKIAESLSQRVNVQLSIFGNVLLKVGEFAIKVFLPAIEHITSTLGFLSGALVAGAKWLNPFNTSLGDVELTAYDAAGGTEKLNNTLAIFYGAAAPHAAAASITAANANYEHANSAYEAAKGELAKVRAMNAAAEARLNAAGAAMPFGTAAGKEFEAEATRRLDAAEADLNATMAKRKTVANAITGAMSEVMTTTIETNSKIEIVTETLGNAGTVGVGAFDDIVVAATDAETIFDTLETSISRVFTSMGRDAKEVARSMIEELYNVLVVQKLVGSFGKEGIEDSGIMGFIGGLLTGSKAEGGAVRAGEPYLVGERGPELFTPSNSGNIASNGSGGDVVVNQTIHVTTGVQQTVRAEIMGLMPQIAEASKMAVRDAAQRGGSYRSAFS